MRYDIHYDFVKHRKYFFGASIAITLIGLVMLLLFGLHYGIDFKSGTTVDMTLGSTVSKDQADKMFKDVGLEPTVLTIGGTNSDRVSARYDVNLSEENVKKITSTFTTTFGNQVSSEVNTVVPDMAQELGRKAVLSVIVASLAICLYVTIRFEWRFAVSAIITILYDAFFVIAIFSIFRFEVDLPFVAAVLTTIGYSINDKIVILDRIRENMRFSKLRTEDDLAEVVNRSIWQTMGRSINTVITVLLAVVCLFIFGSEAIKLFALAKIFGLISGVYSSVCLTTQLWFLLKRSSLRHKKAAAVTNS